MTVSIRDLEGDVWRRLTIRTHASFDMRRLNPVERDRRRNIPLEPHFIDPLGMV